MRLSQDQQKRLDRDHLESISLTVKSIELLVRSIHSSYVYYWLVHCFTQRPTTNLTLEFINILGKVSSDQNLKSNPIRSEFVARSNFFFFLLLQLGVNMVQTESNFKKNYYRPGLVTIKIRIILYG